MKNTNLILPAILVTGFGLLGAHLWLKRKERFSPKAMTMCIGTRENFTKVIYIAYPIGHKNTKEITNLVNHDGGLNLDEDLISKFIPELYVFFSKKNSKFGGNVIVCFIGVEDKFDYSSEDVARTIHDHIKNFIPAEERKDFMSRFGMVKAFLRTYRKKL